MRTKALLLSAMLGIAGVASSFAQNVYSVNVVGYMTLTLTNEFSLIANQLDNGAENYVTNLFAGASGLVANTLIYKYNGTGYDSLRKTSTGWALTLNMKAGPGEGLYIKKPLGSGPLTVTFVGEVLQGTLVNPVPLGFTIESSMVPQEGGIATLLGYAPSTNDVVYRWTGASYAQKRWTGSSWSPAPNVEPYLNVGEAVYINSRAAKDWTRTFTIN